MQCGLRFVHHSTQAGDDITSYSVNGYLLFQKQKDGKLIGTISVSIDVKSKSGKHDYAFSDVKLRITVSHTGKPIVDHQWTVTSVEQL